MRITQGKFAFFAFFILSIICGFSTSGLAMPLSLSIGSAEFSAQADQDPSIVEVRYRRGRDAGIAAGIFGGLVAGAIIGSQNSYYPYNYGYYYPSYGYYGPYPSRDAAVAYCLRQFRSYDPYSMTYLGYDGFRHPCP